MNLFVGNVSRNVSERQLESEFSKFGQCRVDKKVFTINKGNYAFIEFESEEEAENAKNSLQGKELGGLSINIEWGKRSGRYNPRDGRSQ